MIFISHSKSDLKLVELFVDTLEESGIEQNHIFFSSRYHTGAKAGEDFTHKIHDAIIESDVIILIITPNFYRSAYCMQELGAAWILKDYDTKVIPFIVGITFEEMQGFINKYTVTFQFDEQDFRSFASDLKEKGYQVSFSKDSVSRLIAEAKKTRFTKNFVQTSELQSFIEQNRLTQNEYLLLNFTMERQNPVIFVEKTSNEELETYCLNHKGFDYESALNMLYDCGLVEMSTLISGETAYKLKDSVFRDLISSEFEFAQIISSKAKALLGDSPNSIKIDIMRPNCPSNVLMMLGYIIDTKTSEFGSRWKADQTIESIQKWEEEMGFDNILSSNYEDTLKYMHGKGWISVKEKTSYGNPRLYSLNDHYSKQLFSSDVKECIWSLLADILLGKGRDYNE